ncbi:AfsA-related hotdog domain-containing protein [Streptomyces sp. NPDC006259]|uniref:AfsA-related hotdog domain-containing protein n=1 Tax=Streptomyces sp. NPDC006259 TaxID=3364740 RepID=UPI0036893B75
MNTLFVVGDRYAAFADQTGAVTVSRLVSEIRAGALRPPAQDPVGPLVLAEGQGVSPYDWELIVAELARQGMSDGTRILRAERGTPATRAETHKHRERNVLIAGLTRTDEHTFTASLRIDNDEELQLDHQASHVQGMVLLEAARQMYLAVCERHYASRWPERHYAYVFESLHTTFRNFVFPLETTIRCQVLGADLSDPELLSFDVQVDFGQARLHAAGVRMVGTAFDRELMARKEARGAQRSVRQALRGLPAPADLVPAG